MNGQRPVLVCTGLQLGKGLRDMIDPARTTIALGGLEVPVIDRGSLIANKRALGRAHDLDGVKGLEG